MTMINHVHDKRFVTSKPLICVNNLWTTTQSHFPKQGGAVLIFCFHSLLWNDYYSKIKQSIILIIP